MNSTGGALMNKDVALGSIWLRTAIDVDSVLNIACRDYFTIKRAMEEEIIILETIPCISEDKEYRSSASTQESWLELVKNSIGKIKLYNFNRDKEWEENWQKTSSDMARKAIRDAVEIVAGLNAVPFDEELKWEAVSAVITSIRRRVEIICEKINKKSKNIFFESGYRLKGAKLNVILKFCDHLEQDFKMQNRKINNNHLPLNTEEIFEQTENFFRILQTFFSTAFTEELPGYIPSEELFKLESKNLNSSGTLSLSSSQKTEKCSLNIEEIIDKKYTLLLNHSLKAKKQARNIIKSLNEEIKAKVNFEVGRLIEMVELAYYQQKMQKFAIEVQEKQEIFRYLSTLYTKMKEILKLLQILQKLDLEKIKLGAKSILECNVLVHRFFLALEAHWDFIQRNNYMQKINKSLKTFFQSHQSQSNFTVLMESKEILNNNEDILPIMSEFSEILEKYQVYKKGFVSEEEEKKSLFFENLVIACTAYCECSKFPINSSK